MQHVFPPNTLLRDGLAVIHLLRRRIRVRASMWERDGLRVSALSGMFAWFEVHPVARLRRGFLELRW